MSVPAIGVIFHPRFPPETLVDFARRAESGGFDELWLWDDCFLPGAFDAVADRFSAGERFIVGDLIVEYPDGRNKRVRPDITFTGMLQHWRKSTTVIVYFFYKLFFISYTGYNIF